MISFIPSKSYLTDNFLKVNQHRNAVQAQLCKCDYHIVLSYSWAAFHSVENIMSLVSSLDVRYDHVSLILSVVISKRALSIPLGTLLL